MPINPGLLLNLALQDLIVEVDGIVGNESSIVSAMEAADVIDARHAPAPLRVVR
jgi:hypothetical protein